MLRRRRASRLAAAVSPFALGLVLVTGGCGDLPEPAVRGAPTPAPGTLEDDETPDADEQLASLGVGEDEYVADEEDETGLAEAGDLPTSSLEDPDPNVDPWADVEGDDPGPLTAEDLAVPSPEGLDADLMDTTWDDDALDALPEELPEPSEEPLPTLDLDAPSDEAAPGAARTARLGLDLGGASRVSPAARPLVDWWNRTSACAYPTKDCICRGSPFNCQFASAQPGRNRYLPPAAIRAIRSMPRAAKVRRHHAIERLGRWDVPEGTPVYDGLGTLRGTLRKSQNRNSGQSCWAYAAERGKFRVLAADHPCVKVNFGLLKTLTVPGEAPQKFVYAFATNQGSSWIPLSAVRALVKDGGGRPAFRAYDRPPRRPLVRDQKTAYVHWVRSAEDYGATFDQFAPTDAWLKYLPAWAKLKVRPKSEISKVVDPSSPLRGTSEMARDYLLRSENVLNLVYQTPLLGGAATDTFLVRRNALSFRRVLSTNPNARTLLRIWLYRPKTVNDPGTKRAGKMYFVFGQVDGRYGWIAAQALKAETPKARCARGDRGWFCGPDGRGYECEGGQVTQGKSCTQPGQRCRGAADDRATVGANAELVCAAP